MTKTAKYRKTYDSGTSSKSNDNAEQWANTQDPHGRKSNLKSQFIKEWHRRDTRRENRRVKRIENVQRKKVCYSCRQSGHNVSECKQVTRDVESGVGVCFICGSTEHTIASCTQKPNQKSGGKVKYPYAKCFICNEMGHLSKECPDNPRGLYPEGGGCKLCGSVEHFKRDCPKQLAKEIGGKLVELDVLDGGASADAEVALQHVNVKAGCDTRDDADTAPHHTTDSGMNTQEKKRKRKIVTF